MNAPERETRPLANPYTAAEGYHCFGCAPENLAGLNLRFVRERRGGDEDAGVPDGAGGPDGPDGWRVVAMWTPRLEHQGYPGIVHGGLQATAADEVGAWFVNAVIGTAGVTTTLAMTYHEAARMEDAPFRVAAEARSIARKEAVIAVSLTAATGVCVASGQATYALFPEAVARKRLGFPGRDAFIGA